MAPEEVTESVAQMEKEIEKNENSIATAQYAEPFEIMVDIWRQVLNQPFDEDPPTADPSAIFLSLSDEQNAILAKPDARGQRWRLGLQFVPPGLMRLLVRAEHYEYYARAVERLDSLFNLRGRYKVPEARFCQVALADPGLESAIYAAVEIDKATRTGHFKDWSARSWTGPRVTIRALGGDFQAMRNSQHWKMTLKRTAELFNRKLSKTQPAKIKGRLMLRPQELDIPGLIIDQPEPEEYLVW